MARILLIFGVALVALMAGALFYAARIPVENAAPAVVENVEPPPPLEITSHPSFSMPDVDGVVRESSEWDGKKKILNFWATWCGPCKREIPLLKAMQDEHGDAGFQIIGIAADFPEEVAEYAAEVEFNYPILVGEGEAIKLAESSGYAFGALPFTMFIAHDGEYLGAYTGELHAEHFELVVSVMNRLESGEIDKDGAKQAIDVL